MTNKQIPTKMTAVYTGNNKAVAAEANMKRPQNPEEVIARNTTHTIEKQRLGEGNPLNGVEKSCRCGKSCCGANR